MCIATRSRIYKANKTISVQIIVDSDTELSHDNDTITAGVMGAVLGSISVTLAFILIIFVLRQRKTREGSSRSTEESVVETDTQPSNLVDFSGNDSDNPYERITINNATGSSTKLMYYTNIVFL